MSIYTTLGKRVRDLRKESSITQIKLSEITGIDRAQLSKIEKGKINVTLDTIDKLGYAFNVHPSKLLAPLSSHTLRPFVKWAGGKNQIIDLLKKSMPISYNRYFEPFVGGGALFFNIAPEIAFINDTNTDLMSVYQCINDSTLFQLFINEVTLHERNHSEQYYLDIRKLDQLPNYRNLEIYKRAARMIYLNKSCFNGLYRVNSKGFFNVPSAKKDRILAFDRDNILELRSFFSNNKITITNKDFSESVENANLNDFVYFDPPYDTYEDRETFTAYSKEKFGKAEQARLAELARSLSSRGVKVMLSNHNTRYITELYHDFNIKVIYAKRMINSNPNGRGNVEEVIITNY
jgi:DNA adenine methylase